MRYLPRVVVMGLTLTAATRLFASARGDSREDSWLKILAGLRNPDVGVRRKGAESLPDPSVRLTPEQSRALRGHLVSLEKIIRGKHEDPHVRERLIHGLAVFGRPSEFAIATLIDVTRDNTDDVEVRAGAIAALPYIGTHKRVRSTILAATRDPNETIRVNAFQALASPGGH